MNAKLPRAVEAPGTGGTQNEGHHCPHSPRPVTLGGAEGRGLQPACVAFLSPGPCGHFVCTVRYLPSTFHLCFSLISWPLSAWLSRGRSELAGIEGAPDTTPPSAPLPPVHPEAGTPSTPLFPQNSPWNREAPPTAVAGLCPEGSSHCWLSSWPSCLEPGALSPYVHPSVFLCLLEPENKPHSPLRLQGFEGHCL